MSIDSRLNRFPLATTTIWSPLLHLILRPVLHWRTSIQPNRAPYLDSLAKRPLNAYTDGHHDSWDSTKSHGICLLIECQFDISARIAWNNGHIPEITRFGSVVLFFFWPPLTNSRLKVDILSYPCCHFTMAMIAIPKLPISKKVCTKETIAVLESEDSTRSCVSSSAGIEETYIRPPRVSRTTVAP